jgi:excinuclease ABC subunit C
VAREGGQWPSLILIDGGKGQLSSAMNALHSIKGIPKIPIASLAKEDEEIFLPENSKTIRLSKESPALHILQAARDEAHRFAVAFHRQRRDNIL